MSRIACPHCRMEYNVPENADGKTTTCKSCGGQFTIAIPKNPIAPVKPPASIAPAPPIYVEKPAPIPGHYPPPMPYQGHPPAPQQPIYVPVPVYVPQPQQQPAPVPREDHDEEPRSRWGRRRRRDQPTTVVNVVQQTVVQQKEGCLDGCANGCATIFIGGIAAAGIFMIFGSCSKDQPEPSPSPTTSIHGKPATSTPTSQR